MKWKIETAGGCLIMMLALVSGCDTSKNTPNPGRDFFIKYYGGEGYQTGVDVAPNTDGTFILLGTTGKTAAASDARLFLVKADALGNVIWENRFGGLTGNEAVDVELLSNSQDIIVVSNEIVSSGRQEVFVQRFSNATGVKLGDSVMVTIYNFESAPGTDDKHASAITELSNGDFIIAGSLSNLTDSIGPAHQRDAFEVKLHGSDLSTYDASWKAREGKGTDNVATRVFEVAQDTLYVCGYSNASGSATAATDDNFTLLNVLQTGERVDNSSGLIGEVGPSERLGDALFINDATGKNFFLSGITTAGPQSDIYIAELALAKDAFKNQRSVILFKRNVGVSLNTPGTSKTSMAVDQDKSIYVLTNSASTGSTDLFLIKLNSQGAPYSDWISGRTYGGAGEDFAGAIKILPDGRLIICGTLSINGESKMTLMKVNNNGGFAE